MKRWFFIVFILGIFFFTTIALISSHVSFPLILPTGKILNSRFYDYSGITHVHSALSTGSGTVSAITKAAAVTGCNFLILTDLNPLNDGHSIDGYHDDVLVIWAGEYSYLGGHLLSYDIPEARKFNGPGQAQIFFNDYLEKKPTTSGFVIAAHPFLPQHSWENLKLSGLRGMEVLNLESLWHSEIVLNKLSILWSFIILPFNADLSYLRLSVTPTKELAVWDNILKTKSFLGFGGNDSTANAIPFPDQSYSFPSYARSFRLLRDHVLLTSELTGSYDEDRKKIMTALDRGNFYFSVDLIGDPTGFYFIGLQKRKESLPGGSLEARGGAINFVVDLGHDIGVNHEIILLKNGQKVASSTTSSLTYAINHETGSYRAIVNVTPILPFPDGKKTITWIYSNAIRVE
jgi:hypothetical protein